MTQSALPSQATVKQSTRPDATRMLMLFIMVVSILYFGKEVLIPVTFALLLAFILAPVVNLLRKFHLGHAPSVLIAVVLALGVILSIGGIIGNQLADLSADLPKYAGTFQAKITSARDFTVGRLSKLADSVGTQGHAAKTDTAPAGSATQTRSYERQTTTQSSGPASNPVEIAKQYLGPVLAPLGTFGIVFIVAVFVLLQREDLRDRLIRLAGSNDLNRTTRAIDDGGRRLSRYFLTQLSINAAFGVVIGMGLLIIGIPNPVLWGILSALMRFVPYVGTPLAAVLPLALAAGVDPGWSLVISTACFYVIIEALTGQVIEPTVYGHSTGLSPFSVVVAALFWSWVWGPTGLILSTPLTLCLVVLGRHVKKLEFLDIILGDRPALTPAESFYQRILKADTDEALDQAEHLLKEYALATYYDEVAVKGLQMAAHDVERGVLDAEQTQAILETMRALIEGLQEHPDIEPEHKAAKDEPLSPSEKEDALPHLPPPESVDTAGFVSGRATSADILCIAGRGSFDEATAAMLQQLLVKHGLNGRIIGYEDVSRKKINSLNAENCSMVCISHLNASGSPSHLRYLVRRLKQRLPEQCPVLLGVWPADDTSAMEKQNASTVGADHYVTSLAQAVSICVKEANDTNA